MRRTIYYLLLLSFFSLAISLDMRIFNGVNQFAFKYFWLDALAIFFAKYFGYILVFLLLSFLFWPSKTKKAEWSDFLFENLKKYWLMIVQAFLAGILARFVIVDIIRWFFDRPRPFVENHVNFLCCLNDYLFI